MRILFCEVDRPLTRLAILGSTGSVGRQTLDVLPEVDVVMNAVVGAVGLEPSLQALAAGKSLALANKEAMVMAGGLLTDAAAASGAQIRPVDSEHSAIWQCLAGEESTNVSKL